ncbi:hypothetical protein HY095_01140 [Candidatus Micrarchaeota archaeon]|nr:hypothetical protein [Candidatus Micrarchaeota archaeon]
MGDRNKLIAWFREIGFKPRVDDFQDRLVAQKIVFLLELKKLHAGFKYNLHVRGPYSPELAHELFSHKREFESLNTSAELSASEKEKVDEFKELFGTNASLLEAASTYAYFVSLEGSSPIDAIGKVKGLKPFISEANIAVGISKVKQFLYPPSEEEIKGMKVEFSDWERAAAYDLEKILDEKGRTVAN